MILGFYLLVSIGVAVYLFKVQKKNIHVLEVFTYWSASSLLVQNYSAIQTMNYKSSIILSVVSLGLANLVIRTALYPAITILFMNLYFVMKGKWRKILLMAGFAALLTGLESLSDFLRVFVHVTWTMWLSALFWLGYLVVLVWFGKYFRKKLFAWGA